MLAPDSGNLLGSQCSQQIKGPPTLNLNEVVPLVARTHLP